MEIPENIPNSVRSKILIDALPHIQRYNGKIVVVKYGGNAMTNEALKQAVMSDIVLLSLVGIKVVLVHGGGPEINDMLRRLNIESKFIGGLRYTDKETVDVVKMVLAGKVNKELVALLAEHQGSAVGLCGIDGQMLMAEKVESEQDLGYVGDIVSVNTKPILDALNGGYVPVIATVASSKSGQTYNVNADTAAARLAEALQAEKLILLTDVRGLLKDPHDERTLIHVVHTYDVPALVADGTISGGMIPKMECCVDAINGGVERVHILDGRIPHSILIELLSDRGIGTMLKKEL